MIFVAFDSGSKLFSFFFWISLSCFLNCFLLLFFFLTYVLLLCLLGPAIHRLCHQLCVLSGLLGFVRLQDFTAADPALFNQLVTALSKSLAHQAQVSTSHTAFLCHRRREFYLSHLPAYFSDVSKRSMLSSPVVFADSLLREEDVSRLLEATRSSSSLKSQQAMVDVASQRSSTSSSFRRRRGSPPRSPRRSPAQRRCPASASPSRSSKRVRFDSPTPSSALKSPRKSHFRD